MSKPAIEIKGLSKAYMIGHEREAMAGTMTFRDSLVNVARKPIELITGHQLKKEKFWALKDISLKIEQGDVVGIIGRNGSGKSTLLKILSRIVEPTKGEVIMRGRVASLLEVGTGFHPELTGRENIYFNGAILGMTRREIQSKFDEIVAFSEVEKFLDTPVKFYSSGMYVRLAFAVAAHLDPDILVVDEVLAVGDAAFQKKCLGKMQQVARDGRTVLFVSHSMDSVRRLCTKGVLMDGGKVIFGGDIQSAIRQYYSSGGIKKASWKRSQKSDGGRSGNEYVRIDRMEILVEGKVADAPMRNNQTASLQIEGEILKTSPSLNIGVAILNDEGETLFWSFSTDSLYDQEESAIKLGKFSAIVCLPRRILNEGDYVAEFLASLHNQRWLYEPGNSVSVQFSIREGLSESSYWQAKRPGLVAPLLKWDIKS